MKLSALLLGLLVGCSSGAEPDILPDGHPHPPDSAPTCQAQPCGLPGQDDCCMDSQCVDYGAAYGSSQCAMACEANADCATGACVTLQDNTKACAPKEYGGIGGIWPDEICRLANNCGIYTDRDQCMQFFTGSDDLSGCLGTLTQAQLASWLTAAQSDDNSQNCQGLYSLPGCTFTEN